MATQSQAPSILLTRPAAQGHRFARALRAGPAKGLQIRVSPLIEPEFLEARLPCTPSALILTSETGAGAATRLWPFGGIRAWCVGDRTAHVARKAGFDAISAAGDADALVALIRHQKANGPLIHLGGHDSRGEVADRLNSYGIETHSVVAYRQRARPLGRGARAVLAGAAPVLLPVFSPRTALILASELDRQPAIAPLWIAALSPAVAQAVGFPAARLQISVRPDAKGMVEAVAELLASGGRA